MKSNSNTRMTAGAIGIVIFAALGCGTTIAAEGGTQPDSSTKAQDAAKTKQSGASDSALKLGDNRVLPAVQKDPPSKGPGVTKSNEAQQNGKTVKPGDTKGLIGLPKTGQAADGTLPAVQK
jgi:hypothetical protein